jgi:uncharacterized protein YvpB
MNELRRLFALAVPAAFILAAGCAVDTESADDLDGLAETDESELVNASTAFCPSGFSYDATHRICASSTQALGPFTAQMTARCKSAGGGQGCDASTWALGFARSIRGTGTCPPGATLDNRIGYCVEGNNAFGPFTKALVDRCKAGGGGPACETMRWAKSMIPAQQQSNNGALSVPYFYQYNNANEPGGTCGVTSAAMLLNFWGKSVTPDGLYRTYGKAQGQSPGGLADIYRWQGYSSQSTYGGSFAMIKRNIDAGRPVVVHGYFTASGHIMVVIGYDSTGFIVNDPAGKWKGCFKCGYEGSRTSTNGRGVKYSYESMRSALGNDGTIWLSAADRKAFTL